MRWLPIAAVFLVTFPSAVAEAQTPNVREKDVSKLLAAVLDGQGDPGQQAELATEIAGLEPADFRRFNKALDAELQKLRVAVQPPAADPDLQKQIAVLRAKLAQLRADQDLSKEMIEETAKPALDRLASLVPMARGKTQQGEEARAQLLRLREILTAVKARKPSLNVTGHMAVIRAMLNQAEPSMDVSHRRILDQNQAIAKTLDESALAGLRKLNEMRMLCGLNPLAYDPKLCRAARDHSADMKKLDFFSHTSPVSGKESFTDRAKLAGTSASGENIYMGSDSSRDAIKTWFYSPQHHRIMFGDFTRVGLGSSGEYWTMMLGRNRSIQ